MDQELQKLWKELLRNRPRLLSDAPEVFLDFELEDEFLFIVLKNNSPHPALHVRVGFSQPIPGLGGTKKIHALNLFNQLSYLAPEREFRVYVDRIDVFLEGLRRAEILVNIKYQSEQGRVFSKRIIHDLDIYRDLPIIKKT
jgi:hypothetical protein